MDLRLNDAVVKVELSGIRQFTYLVRDTPGACALTIGEPDLNTPDAIKEAAKAALEGAEATKQFTAKFGRAKSYGEQTIGTPDAGATSMSLFFQGLAQH